MKNILISTLFLALVGCATPQQLPIQIPATQPIARKVESVDVALVLGGGGSKGLAHVGVIEVLEENNIPLDLIVGVSSGAAMGALYADNPNAVALKEKVLPLSKWDLLDLSLFSAMQSAFTSKGAVQGNSLKKFIFDNAQSENIEDLKIPFVAVAADAKANELYTFKSGPLAPAVNASAAIPPFFSPVELYGRTFIDGGAITPVPVAVAKEYNPKIVISVDISAPPPCGNLGSMIDISYRAMWMSYYELCRMQAGLADIDIHPDLTGFGTFDDDKNFEIYMAGRRAAEAALPQILEKLAENGINASEKAN